MKQKITLVSLGLILMSLCVRSHGDIQEGFYKGKCNNTTNVEKIVTRVVKKHFLKDQSVSAALIRMQFHDCFVHGCDASILVDGNSTEKVAPPNGSLRGFEVVDEAKAALENICPGVVSCADIIVVAARAAVFHVETGRRDGLISQASDVDLPSPFLNVSSHSTYTIGGHSVGMAHCSFVEDRLYNSPNAGGTDENMNPTFAQFLKMRCPKHENGKALIPLNSMTRHVNLMDNSFYKQILEGRGILQIDQEIALDSRTNGFVNQLAKDNREFLDRFGEAMVKMGSIEVLTGNQGEIRSSCRSFNA